MTTFRTPLGFEEALRPPVNPRRARMTPEVLPKPGAASTGSGAARFVRVARRTPEVMIKITGKTRDGSHLRAHLDYISRNGGLSVEDDQGALVQGRRDIGARAREWAEEAAMEAGRRRDAPIAMSVVLSMPAGTDALILNDAARAFASATFADRFAYVFTLHDEGRHPHVHLTVRMSGRDGERLNPRKADLQLWRERFAQTLRDRGVEAEATPRRTRGQTRKAERLPVRKMRERFLAGKGELPQVLAGAYKEALSPAASAPWVQAIQAREARIRTVLIAEALGLQASRAASDRLLGALVERFVRDRKEPETRDQQLRRMSREREAPADRERPR